MFLLNFGALPPRTLFEELSTRDDVPLQGACLLASGYDHARLKRNELPAASTLLFDPQLYLSVLQANPDDGRIWRLASHPWFMVDGVPEYDSEEFQKKKDWEGQIQSLALNHWKAKPPSPEQMEQAAKAAVQTQVELDCTYIVLPTPLLADREDEAQPAVDWINAGVRAAKALEATKPLLATVALLDGVLNDLSFSEMGYLDAVVTQVAACPGISGVYIVVVQQNEPAHPFDAKRNVWRAYTSLCKRFRSVPGMGTILPNFCDLAGILCLGLGASGFATGNYQSTRRVHLPYKSEGRAYPYFFTTKSAAELRPETDLPLLAKHGLLPCIADETPFSKQLLEKLAANEPIDEQVAWAQTQGNVNVSHRHMIYRMNSATKQLLARSPEIRVKSVKEWLEKGAVNQQKVKAVLKDEDGTRRFASMADLQAAFSSV